MTDLYTEIHGCGDPVVLLHGSGSWGADTFGAQLPLAGEFRLILVDRRGYGRSPAAQVMGWPVDQDDIAGLLAEIGGAHLVGHSSGGTVALLAAARVPHAVRSLVVVEPTVWGVADPADSPPERPAAYQETWTRARDLAPLDFLIVTTAVTGLANTDALMRASWARASPADVAAVAAMRRETWAGSAKVDVGTLAAAGFPKTVAVGAWDTGRHPELASMWESGWHQAVAAEHGALAAAIGARLVTFSRSAHSPMVEEPETFNAMLREAWRAARPG